MRKTARLEATILYILNQVDVDEIAIRETVLKESSIEYVLAEIPIRERV